MVLTFIVTRGFGLLRISKKMERKALEKKEDGGEKKRADKKT